MVILGAAALAAGPVSKRAVPVIFVLQLALTSHVELVVPASCELRARSWTWTWSNGIIDTARLVVVCLDLEAYLVLDLLGLSAALF